MLYGKIKLNGRDKEKQTYSGAGVLCFVFPYIPGG